MIGEIIWEMVLAIGRFFINPLLYIFIAFSIYIGVQRVKNERKHFHIRVYDVVDDLISPLSRALLVGVFASFLFITIGVVVPTGLLALFALLSVFTIFLFPFRWTSFSAIASLSMFVILLQPSVPIDWAFLNTWLNDLRSVDLSMLAIFIAVLSLVETYLITTDGSKRPSPRLQKGTRGKPIGLLTLKQLWIVPLVTFWPVGSLELPSWWPTIYADGSQWGLVLFPVTLSYHHDLMSQRPEEATGQFGKRSSLVVLLVTFSAVMALFYPVFAVVTAVLALFGREFLFVLEKMKETKGSPIYTLRERGLVVVGVLPQSPAEKMNIQVAELITNVNGVEVKTEREFYEALQTNSAYCKLQVVDGRGEVRFAQTAIYDGEHHQIGLLFITDESQKSKESLPTSNETTMMS
ncbi:PDZ domain-containing protein [Texcoconibacillus texcoconensis]|uniref:PDZ domain-containing protein n=1 Tax=Texcoconibacillus texcoconensis TaxID=1095777 RepID=A0A840QQ00_9BACI|nr:PDZ domain-containing protein [Texcoconibacillus texcoconensis]MBB5173429.1 hypothetical protein [Texcoconibacillus texcoconensis]